MLKLPVPWVPFPVETSVGSALGGWPSTTSRAGHLTGGASPILGELILAGACGRDEPSVLSEILILWV